MGAEVVGSGYGSKALINQILGPVIFEGLGFAAYLRINPQAGF